MNPFGIVTITLVVVIVVLVVVIWSIRRHRNPKLKVKCDAPIHELMPSLAGLTLTTVHEGNSVEVLENGAFWDRVIERIGAAEKSVHFETFLWKDGVLGRRLAAALVERARAGCKVRVLLDAVGSKKVGEDVVKQMRDAGCRLEFFHKRSIYTIGVINDRDHRKMVIIDGQEAFIGGHCVVDDWLGDAEDGKHFADVSVQLHGPIVHSIQAAFSENWAGATGEMFVGDAYFPALRPTGDVPIHASYAKPESSAPAVKILHHTAICLAKKNIWIQNPYFIPDLEAIKAFGEAVKRGVDVRVVMPSTGGSDSPMVQYAGHRNFERLMLAGVRLFEYPHTLLHQKVMTIDGIWSAVGSTNFDDRSFETNDEITLGMLDARVTATLDAILEKNVVRCKEVKLETWRKRGLVERAKERMYYAIKELL